MKRTRGHTKCCTVTQNHLSKPEELVLQNATALRKSAPWPPNISDEDVSLYCTCQATFIFAEPPRKPHACQRFWNCYKTVTFCSLLTRCAIPLRWPRQTTSESLKVLCTHQFFYTFDMDMLLRATTACTFSTSQLPKVVRSWCALYILTSKCASRHNGVHFFDISTSKIGPTLVCFVHFGNVLRATTACNFSSLIWPDGSAPVALANLLFDPPEPQIIGKTEWIATFLPFRASASFFFSLFLFSDLFSAESQFTPRATWTSMS